MSCSRIPVRDPYTVEALEFRPGVNVRVFCLMALDPFIELKSICIPQSVETLRGSLRALPGSALRAMRFAPGSKLRRIEDFVFDGCLGLKSVSLPASVERLAALSFRGSGLEEIQVDPGNPHFTVVKSFLIRRNSPRAAVWYFGKEPQIELENDIEEICQYCFSGRESLRVVTFGDSSRLRMIDASAFLDCRCLESIGLPSSLEQLDRSCFENCGFLSEVSFGPNSQLRGIGQAAFEGCFLLKSIVIPGLVGILHERCCAKCASLSEVLFELPSRLAGTACP
jgi:hypothetical protein